MKNPVFVKVAAIGGVLLMLIFGLNLIGGIVRDRQFHRDAATRSVAQSLAGSQTLIGPLIHSQCVETWDVVTGSGGSQTRSEQRREFLLTALPDDLNVTADVAMEPRARGLHKVNTFALKARLAARWNDLASLQPQPTVKNSRLHCDAPVLMVAVSDARGIRTAQLQLDGQDQPLKPGTQRLAYPRGVHAVLPELKRQRSEPLSALVNLELAGTERFGVVPLAGTTAARLTSGWPHPSFDGRFLPAERAVGAKGFEAVWRLSALATTAPQDIVAGKPVCAEGAPEEGSAQKGCADAFGVSFFDPVNPYALSDRATKYGLLFVALTFVAVGLFEFMKQLRVHPVQYLLVGSALCIFFLLLVSLGEHLPFGLAYSIAATACVGLLAFYASHMLGSLRRGIPFGLGIAALYGTLYLLLQLEQTALVIGAVALFGVLATVMVLTRQIDWYARLASRAGPTPAP